MTEFGVGDNREPMLGDTFEADQRFSRNTHKNFDKEFINVGYSFCKGAAAAAFGLESVLHL